MKRNVQQRSLFHLGDSSIRTVVHKYNPTKNLTKAVAELPTYHQHDGYQLVYMINGQASFMVDDEIFKLTKGNLFYLSANLPHAIVSVGKKPEAIVIQFKDDILPKNFSEIPEFKFVNVLMKKGVGGLAFREIPSNMLESLAYAAGISKVSSLLYTLDYLGRNIASAELLSKRTFNKISEGELSEKYTTVSALAHQYLMEHYRDDIKLSDIADFCHQQEAALCRTYKRETGMTLFQHLQFIRIESACTMLRNTSLTIAQVAYSCGFNTPSTFNRLFMAKMGMTPRAYRSV